MLKLALLVAKLGLFPQYLLTLPVYCVSYFIPKKSNIWVFGAWFGKRYSDNSKYLFEYVNRYMPQIKAVWACKNQAVLTNIRNRGYNCYRVFSYNGLKYISQAGVFIYCQSFSADITRFIYSKKSIRINLWHGIPTKKTGKDKFNTKKNSGYLLGKIKKAYNMILNIFPYYKEPNCFFISSSREVSKILRSAFRDILIDVWETGYPRLDNILKNCHTNQNKNRNNIIYMPTYRKYPNIEMKLFNNFDVKKIENKLLELKANLTIRLHPASCVLNDDLIAITQSSVINIDNSDDIYDSLLNYDILITDFSSIFFDYLNIDKPIIFAPFYMEDYLINDRELNFKHGSITPGPICESWDEIMFWVETFMRDPKQYSTERNNLRKRIFSNQSARSSEKIIRHIFEKIESSTNVINNEKKSFNNRP